MRRSLSFLAFFALSSLIPATAAAQSWGARVVRALDSIGRADVLADRHGKIPISAILPQGVSPAAIGLGAFDEDTASMRLSPAQVIALGEQHPEIEISVGPGLRPLIDVSRSWTRALEFRTNAGTEGAGVVVGVIDTGIDILHPDFRNKDGTTRIKWLLQAELPGTSGKYNDLNFKYCGYRDKTCAILDEADINAIIAKNNGAAGTDDNTGHGTHVASIAAGNGGPMVNEVPRYVGVAPAADLIIGALDGFRDDDVADAAKFIFERAEEMGEPCVINLSLGSDYGAHDGSDILDRRLSRMVGDDKPGRAIVAAAGNSGGLYIFDGEDTPRGIHTEARVYPHSDVRVPIYAPSSSGDRDSSGFIWVTFDPGDEVSISFEGPGGGVWTGPVSPGREGAYESGKSRAIIVNNKFKPGASLVPVTNGAVVVFGGEWQEDTEVALRLSGSGRAQMWVTSTGDLMSAHGQLMFKKAIRQGTINVPAAAPSLLAVGCSMNRKAWPTFHGADTAVQLPDDPLFELDSVCYFSASGPTPSGLPKPELIAPGGYVGAAMARNADPRTTPHGLFDSTNECPEGLSNCFVLDDYHAVTIGTSMSAPQVTGAVALLFAKDPKLTQARVTSILQAGARFPKGTVSNEVQLGPGALDLEGARLAMQQESEGFTNPDPAKSWYVLSSNYARPDVEWPVYGTVELRNPDGDVAHAIDGTFLTLDVKNGVVLQPLRKIRHGLWRFAVAGEEGKSGQEMQIDVRYSGTSLGVRSLPIGNDIWSSSPEPLGATGSCALADAGRAGDREWAWLAAAGLGVVLVRSRTRRRRSMG